MLTTPDVAGLVTVLAALPVPFLLRYVRDERGKPGVIWLMINITASGLWALLYGLLVIVNDPQLTSWLLAIDLAVVSVAVISWFLFILEFTHQVTVPWHRVMPPLFVPVILTQVLVWTNSVHNLVFTAESYVDTMGVPRFEAGPWYAVHFGYSVLFPVMSLGMLVGESITSREYRRRHAALLLFATVVPMVAAVVFALDLLPAYFNPTPISFLFVGATLTVALRRYRLLQVKPVPRHTTLKEIEEAVVTVSPDGTILDLNPAARSLFEFHTETPTGRRAQETIVGFGALVADLATSESSQTEVSGDFEGETRHFVVNTSPVEYGRDEECRAIVFRDVTTLKQRERDLTTLKQLLSRVFRHNVRNELTKLIGRAEEIQKHADGVDRDVDFMLDVCRTLQAHSDKARLVERVIDQEGRLVEHSLSDLLGRITSEIVSTYPSATIETDIAPSVVALANIHLEDALYNTIENAIEHNDSATPIVEVTVRETDDSAVVTVSDNGPGIHEREVEVLEQRTETALEHGSGVGLWLVNLVIEKSNGHLDIQGGSDGTTVEIRLPRVPSHPEPSDEGVTETASDHASGQQDATETASKRDNGQQDVTDRSIESDGAEGPGTSGERSPVRSQEGDDPGTGSDTGRTEVADR